MPSGQVAVLEVLINGDATGIRVAMAQAQTATTEFAAASKEASAAQTEAAATSVTGSKLIAQGMTIAKLGAVAFAAASIKSAIDYNRAFQQIAAITNTTSDQIQGMSDTVLRLSSETAVAPVELAHAMYFLASAGLTTEQQMTSLDAVARGVAVGLGDAGDLARITANALNVFADNGLTATDVMDTLTAAIREGTAEPDEFASALGRVLPIADQAGISFQSVAASLASMSNAGLDVNEGVTALRAILQSLVAPTAQTENAFHQMGLSVDQVVASMQGEGLIATLRLIQDRAKGATDGVGEFNQLMRHAIPNIRGLAGAFNLLKQDPEKIDAIFQAVERSAGALDRAFQITIQSDAFKFQKGLNDISIAGQKLGAMVLPLVADGLQYVGGVMQNFSNDLKGLQSGFKETALDLANMFSPAKFEQQGFSNMMKSYVNLLATPLQFMTFGHFPRLITDQDIASTQNQIDQVKLMLASGSIDISNQAIIWQKALDSVGGEINPGNVDQFTNAVRSAITQQELLDQQTKQANQTRIAAAAATRNYTYETNQAARALQGLNAIGMDSTKFLSDLHDTLSNSDDAAKDFGTAIDGLTTQWQQFHDQAVSSLDFASQALTDLGSAAADAQQQLAGDTSSMSSGALADLQNQATVTTQEIENAFQTAYNKTKQFGHDLLDIANFGKSGKALAASLLQSGNTVVAAQIAGADKATEQHLVGLYGKNQRLVDGLSTKLTNSIVGPLNKIVGILTKLAENVWKIDVNGDGVIGVGKQLDKTQHKTDHLTNPAHQLKLNLQDNASHGLDGIQGDVDHLVGNVHHVNMAINDDLAKQELRTLDNNINQLTSKEHLIKIGVHTFPSSPWPDEAIKQHLTDPMKQAGFKKIGDNYTLPLNVGVHTGAGQGGYGGNNRGGMLDLEKRQLSVLIDIRNAIRHGGAAGGGTGSSYSGGSSGGSSSSTSSSDLPKNVASQLKDFRLYISSVQSKKAADRWASAITDAIQKGDMAKEAKLLHQAMRDMAQVTNQKEAQKAFHDFQGAVQDFEHAQNAAEMKQHMEDALKYAASHQPRLPRGHTHHFDQRSKHDKRMVSLNMDRKRFVDSAGYEVDYARGF